jgi:hypothetical protein
MLQFTNETPFKGTILLLPDPDGIDSLYTVIKGTFTLADQPALAEVQEPLTLAQEHYGDPATSSISKPSDISLMKPGTDVVLLGQAHAPDGRLVSHVDVTVTVGTLSKTVRVFGDRHWRQTPTPSISAPEPFQTMPLVWERAYGGVDRLDDDRVAEEERNPVGAGFCVKGGTNPLEGLLLPNLEHPGELISDWRQRPRPACFAPVAPHWEPRRSYAGTYDEDWQQQRAPFLPADFDARFFQVAPEDLVTAGHLTGGERVDVKGATPSGWLQFRLPVVSLDVAYLRDDDRIAAPALLDTVIIEPDDSRLQMVWRAVLQCDKQALRVSEVVASMTHLRPV